MKLSTRSRYGTRLMIEMAQHHEQGPLQLSVIAVRQGIPRKYLEQIVTLLRDANLVKSARGHGGGHMLSRPPVEITLGEVVSVLEGGLKLTDCAVEPAACPRSELCPARRVWSEATSALRQKLDSVTLQDLLGSEVPSCDMPVRV